jgi:hypothetical protein
VTPFIFLLLALSTWRITHLVVEDTIPLVAKPREAIIARNEDGNLAYLLGCTYCSSVWVATLTVLIVDLWMDMSVPVPVAVVGALSIFTAFAETIVDWLDRYGA